MFICIRGLLLLILIIDWNVNLEMLINFKCLVNKFLLERGLNCKSGGGEVSFIHVSDGDVVRRFNAVLLHLMLPIGV